MLHPDPTRARPEPASRPARPVTAADPAWFQCGDPKSPDYGAVFVKKTWSDLVVLSFDRADREPAPSVLPGEIVDGWVELHGRLFRVEAR